MPYKDPEKQREAVRRSQAKRRAAARARQSDAAPGLPDPPDREQLLRILGQRAREGNVPAASRLLEEYRRGDSTEKESGSRSLIDELAARRRSA